MDWSNLIDEIVARVAEKMQEREQPKLLVLTQNHGTECHKLLESKRLAAYYRTECALQQEKDCDVSQYEGVIAFDLTIEAMVKLATGLCDTPFTALAQQAILQGKKIFVPAEAVDLYAYAQTAPSAYYTMLLEKLNFLQQVGFVICPMEELEDAILSGEQTPKQAEPVQVMPAAAQPQKVCTISKRIVTERDVAAVTDRTVTTIRVSERAIVTDLAREYASNRRISIVRE